MEEPVKTPWSSVSALWSLLWRAVVLTPAMMVLGLFWLTVNLLLVCLPIGEVFYVVTGCWLWAAITLVVWILLFFLARARWFKEDSKDFPDGQKNI